MTINDIIAFFTPILKEENRSILTLVFLFFGSIWGVLVKYIAHLKKTKESFRLLIFIGEIMAHSFAGMLAYFSCRGFEINENLTIVITLFFAYVGLKFLNKVEDEIMDAIDNLSEIVSKWVKGKMS